MAVRNPSVNSLLDGVFHSDTVTGTVVRGDIVVGNSTPKWARLAKGSANSVLWGDGTDTTWSTTPVIATSITVPTVYGSSSSGGSLTLESTSDSTKGSVKITNFPATSTTDRALLVGTTRSSAIHAAAIPAQIEIGGTVSTSTFGANSLYISTTFTGSGNQPGAILVDPLYQPSSTIALARGMLVYPKADPATGVAITQFRSIEFGIQTGSNGGTIDTTATLVIGGSSFGSVKPATSSTGIRIDNQGSASIPTTFGIDIAGMSGSTTTVGIRMQGATFYFDLPQDATDPTGGGGAAAGRVPIRVNGATKYLAYY